MTSGLAEDARCTPDISNADEHNYLNGLMVELNIRERTLGHRRFQEFALT